MQESSETCPDCWNVITGHANVQVSALQGQGAPDVESHANIPIGQLPHSQGRLLRPGVVWCARCLLFLVSVLTCMLRTS